MLTASRWRYGPFDTRLNDVMAGLKLMMGQQIDIPREQARMAAEPRPRGPLGAAGPQGAAGLFGLAGACNPGIAPPRSTYSNVGEFMRNQGGR